MKVYFINDGLYHKCLIWKGQIYYCHYFKQNSKFVCLQQCGFELPEEIAFACYIKRTAPEVFQIGKNLFAQITNETFPTIDL